MAYVKVRPPAEVYHLTKKDNLNRILDDGQIRRFGDTECWFCETLPKMKSYMEQTVMCEGKPYYAVGGQLCRYPKFVPEDYVLLKLTPCGYEDKWYRWEQEMPPGSPKALIRAAREFSALKIGYRGDLAFRNAEVINVPKFLTEGIVQSDSVQTTSRLRDMVQPQTVEELLKCEVKMEENMREALETIRAQMHRLVDERIDDAAARMESGEIDYEPVRAHPLDWRPAAFKGTKAVAVILPDGNEVEAKTWRAVVDTILQDCAADPVRLEHLRCLCDRVNGNFRPLLSSRKAEMKAPVEIEDGLYFESKFDTEQLLRVLVEKVLRPVGYDCSSVLLRYRERTQTQEQAADMESEQSADMTMTLL